MKEAWSCALFPPTSLSGSLPWFLWLCFSMSCLCYWCIMDVGMSWQMQLIGSMYVNISDEASRLCNCGNRRVPGIILQAVCKLDSLSRGLQTQGVDGITNSQTKPTGSLGQVECKGWRDWGCDIHWEEKEESFPLQETDMFPFLGQEPAGGCLPTLRTDFPSLIYSGSHTSLTWKCPFRHTQNCTFLNSTHSSWHLKLTLTVIHSHHYTFLESFWL